MGGGGVMPPVYAAGARQDLAARRALHPLRHFCGTVHASKISGGEARTILRTCARRGSVATTRSCLQMLDEVIDTPLPEPLI
jgi:hypothetical protein